MRARLARWSGRIASLAGVGLVSSLPATAQTLSPSSAPVSWMRYAEEAIIAVKTWLQADSETAQRLRAYLDATRPEPDQPTAALQLKIWVDGAGRVSRIAYPSFAQAEANADMHALIVGQHLPGTPPRDILLPMRILVQLDPDHQTSAPAEGASTSAGDPGSTI